VSLPCCQLPPDTPLLIADETTGATLLRSTVGELNGSESPDVIPFWLLDHVLDNRPYTVNAKIGFTLEPFVETKDKDLIQKLTAHRLCRMKRVAEHVRQKLEYGVLEDASRQPALTEPEDCIEIVCNGQVLSPEANLGTVRAFVWKSGDELTLQYRVRAVYTNDKRFRVMKRKK